MQTGFCDWSARYFAQPVMKVLHHSPRGGGLAPGRSPRHTQVPQGLPLGHPDLGSQLVAGAAWPAPTGPGPWAVT